MTLRICLDCTTAYAVGAPRCPHCGSERGQEQGSDPYRGDNTMPKITRHGGPSIAGVAAAPPEAAAPAPAEEVASSPGSSSETSSSKPQTSSEPSAPVRRKRARTTGSRSGKGTTAASTAPSTDGDPTDATSDSTD